MSTLNNRSKVRMNIAEIGAFFIIFLFGFLNSHSFYLIRDLGDANSDMSYYSYKQTVAQFARGSYRDRLSELNMLISVATPESHMVIDSYKYVEFEVVEKNKRLHEKYLNDEIDFYEYWNSVRVFYAYEYSELSRDVDHYSKEFNKARQLSDSLSDRFLLISTILLPLNIIAGVMFASYFQARLKKNADS